MYIDQTATITAASVISALVVIFSAIFAVYRWYLKQNQQDKEIKKSRRSKGSMHRLSLAE
ncbi:MAG: hypothetical protein SOX32_05550 [Candidatus Choladocola sp.]|nr:hypothetical protein [Candidatus Choladocola sp.]